jgi:hypothetical protein
VLRRAFEISRPSRRGGRAGGDHAAVIPAPGRPAGIAGPWREPGNLKSWEPVGLRRTGFRFPDSRPVDPLIRRAARPRFAYTARDMGAAE